LGAQPSKCFLVAAIGGLDGPLGLGRDLHLPVLDLRLLNTMPFQLNGGLAIL
jgi:hypothetical protein